MYVCTVLWTKIYMHVTYYNLIIYLRIIKNIMIWERNSGFEYLLFEQSLILFGYIFYYASHYKKTISCFSAPILFSLHLVHVHKNALTTLLILIYIPHNKIINLASKSKVKNKIWRNKQWKKASSFLFDFTLQESKPFILKNPDFLLKNNKNC